MSGPALFGLKYPLLLQYEHDRQEATTRANLQALCGVARAPSDTRFRERLDEVAPSDLCPLYQALFNQLQRGKGLEGLNISTGTNCSRSTVPATFPHRRCTARSAQRSITAAAPRPTYHQMLGADRQSTVLTSPYVDDGLLCPALAHCRSVLASVTQRRASGNCRLRAASLVKACRVCENNAMAQCDGFPGQGHVDTGFITAWN